MPLRHRRRIFGRPTRALPWRDRRLPSPAVLVIAGCGVAILSVAAWLLFQSAEPPVRSPVASHILADADHVAVLDGDTLRLGGQVVRLAGIAAPARGSACRDADFAKVDCGSASANALASLVHDRSVACMVIGHDDYDRPIGNCSSGGVTISQALVRDGWVRAVAPELQELQAAARASGRGMWRTRP